MIKCTIDSLMVIKYTEKNIGDSTIALTLVRRTFSFVSHIWPQNFIYNLNLNVHRNSEALLRFTINTGRFKNIHQKCSSR